MADVESVEVLKDAATAAIYGSRGAGGVIMVTTKSGKSEKTKYSFKYSVGLKNPYKLYSVMNISEYTQLLFNEGSLRYADSAAYTQGFTSAQRNTFSNNKGNLVTTAERAAYVIENTLTGPTDWQQEALRTGVNKNLQLSASGGSKTAKYYISGGYQKDEGMMVHSNYEKFNLRTKFDAQLSKRVKIQVNINPSYSKRERPSTNFTDFYRFPSYLPVYHTDATAAFVSTVAQWASIKAGDFAQARHFNARVYSGLMPDGSTWVNSGTQNPFATSNNTPKSIIETRSINSNEYRLQSSFSLMVNIIPGLDFKSQASSYINTADQLDFAKNNSRNDGVLAEGYYLNRTSIDLYSENTFTYNKRIKEHTIDAVVGFTAEKNYYKEEQTNGVGYPNDNITTLNNAVLINKDNSYNFINRQGLLSYLGRVNYTYGNKYLLSASVRYDGSSKFAPGNKWGAFPAVSGGWIMSEEKFMNGKIDWLSRLKLRVSYGLTGNNKINDYGFVDLLYGGNYPFGSGNGNVNSGLNTNPNLIANTQITWERTKQVNYGLDVAAFKNRVNLAVDVYSSTTEALLLQQPSMAFTGGLFFNNNIGRIQNSGVEVELSSINVTTKRFKWTTALNFSRNKNNIIELGKELLILNQGERTELYLNQPGNPLIQFFGYKTDGVWLSQQEIVDAQAKGLTTTLGSTVFVPGGLKLVDVNGDNVIDANDRTVIGNPYPKFTWGITNSFNYKSFDLSFTFQGVQGGNLINGDRNYNESRRYIKEYTENRWISPANSGDGKTPYSTIGYNWMLTDYAVEDASYVALREVLLGYTVSSKLAKKVGLSGLRVYASAQNLLFFFPSGYKGLNPEARSASSFYASPLIDGYQRGGFPTSRSFLFGIDINF